MRRTLAILGGLVVGAGLSQFPEYAQQYTQRLGGAVDELKIITEDFDKAATEAGLQRDEAIGRFSKTGDGFIAARGESMARTFQRYEQLSATLAEVRGATGWERFTKLPEYLDSEIGARALSDYQPAVPVTLEGFAYAGAGFFLGYAVLSALVGFLMLPFRRRRVRYVERGT
ncbi:MAG: Methyl-accepting chemotaxis protein [Devosia sp.]|uniref:DUF2937 family protein n=1 Tax=Devosia sp. TaxID=1871048 RepID=UPI0026280DDF|nr:DUF2937 family protein [Devosia sp.]MDB5540929.1 Methyl-accepting chemotaxis protein [Devosia sp.]